MARRKSVTDGMAARCSAGPSTALCQNTSDGALQALAAACAAAEAQALQAMLASQLLQGIACPLRPAQGIALGRPPVASALDSFKPLDHGVADLLALEDSVAPARLQAPHVVPGPPVGAPPLTLPPLQPQPALSWPANGGLPALLEVVQLAEAGTAHKVCKRVFAAHALRNFLP